MATSVWYRRLPARRGEAGGREVGSKSPLALAITVTAGWPAPETKGPHHAGVRRRLCGVRANKRRGLFPFLLQSSKQGSPRDNNNVSFEPKNLEGIPQATEKENTSVLPVSMSGHLNPHTLNSKSISTTGLNGSSRASRATAVDTVCHEVESSRLIPARTEPGQLEDETQRKPDLT